MAKMKIPKSKGKKPYPADLGMGKMPMPFMSKAKAKGKKKSSIDEKTRMQEMAKKVSTGMAGLAGDKKWQAECDMRTLVDAAKIQADRSRLSAARKMASEQASALRNIGVVAKPKASPRINEKTRM